MLASQAEALRRGAELSDAEVVERVRGGDLAAYEILMRRHNQLVYRAVRSILRDETEIEDVLQEAYLAAYRALGGFEGRARFSTWLVRIAVNRALDRRRRAGRLVLVDPTAPDAGAGLPPSRGPDPEGESARRELAGFLERAVDALPEAFRSVYVLREVEGLSTQEVAEALTLEPGTVKTRLHRARAQLRERLRRDVRLAAHESFPFGGQRCNGLVARVLGELAGGG